MWHQFTVLSVLFKECKTGRHHLGYQIQSPHGRRQQTETELVQKGPRSSFFHVPFLAKDNKDKAFCKTLNQSKKYYYQNESELLFQVLSWPRRKAAVKNCCTQIARKNKALTIDWEQDSEDLRVVAVHLLPTAFLRVKMSCYWQEMVYQQFGRDVEAIDEWQSRA